MCGRFALTTPPELIASLFGLSSPPDLRARYNIAPTQDVLIVRMTKDRAAREAAMVRWGLVPSWADDPSIGSRMINARAESAPDKPAFRSAFQKRRCVVPASGFYEWRKTGDAKQPLYVTREDEKPFAMAGLWEAWHDDTDQSAEPLHSCTILTTKPNALLKPIHDRMPVILPHEKVGAWLEGDDPDALADLLAPADPSGWRAHLVSRHVNSPKNDDPECVRPIDEQPPAAGAQGALFS